ncbi:hypothetical protein [Oceanobacillus kapialis]|uniref:Uncharacterized protein n=1 Tax=Oceanobacillus kapialis TaxID=481353 RepID=A0ABW5PZI6_9BACI
MTWDLKVIDWTTISALATLAAVFTSLWLAKSKRKEKVIITGQTGLYIKEYGICHLIKIHNISEVKIFVEDILFTPTLSIKDITFYTGYNLNTFWRFSKIKLFIKSVLTRGNMMRLTPYKYTKSEDRLEQNKLPMELVSGQSGYILVPGKYFIESGFFKEYKEKGMEQINILVVTGSGKEHKGNKLLVHSFN